ncbi:hypothetical protein GCM10009733_082760 [Nonomuraea maheshkhaliensis]|uniref:Uncharacterized protein n=1 Tax=Nonomuraea maheshkhaliensis TaxID=419590 RepID=A0ABN2GL34_9ACTN
MGARGGDPIEISSWINETKSERARLEGELKAVPAAQRVTVAEIRAMIEEVGDLVRLVSEADPDDKAGLYGRLGLKLTCYPEKQYVEARIQPEPPHVRAVCVRGETLPIRTCRSAPPPRLFSLVGRDEPPWSRIWGPCAASGGRRSPGFSAPGTRNQAGGAAPLADVIMRPVGNI